MTNGKIKTWHKALELNELPEGRVKTVTLGVESICMTHFEGEYGALDNKCPHQGGPLGEGSIEGKCLRCPWHGWDFDPLTGKAPGGFDDGVKTYPLDIRDDGIYVEIEEEAPHVRTVSDVMIETMVNWGVKWCFGMVGHSNLHVAEAIRIEEERGTMSYIGIRHEGAASFAASAYGKLTGRPASCLAIAGPGATNLLTGLWDAHVDSASVLALTGQVSTQFLGRHNFQELPLAEAFGGVAEYTQQVMSQSPHAELMSLACKSALLNQSVSHLIFPDEVAGEHAVGVDADTPEQRLPDLRFAPPKETFNQAVNMLKLAKRPVIIVGHGARYHMDTITRLAEKLGAPVATTFKAKGQISDSHPLGCGVLGRSGTPIASWFMNESEVLLVLGASFSNHTGITPKKPTIQVDRDPDTLAKFHKVDCNVCGDIGVTVDLLIEALEENASKDHRSEVAERWAIWREEKANRLHDDFGKGLNSASLFASLTKVCPKDAIMPVDVGNNTYSYGRYFECNQQTVLMSGYLGSIGFSLPAAMGAWAATQEQDTPWYGKKVVSISGDGGFGQYMNELNTLVKYDMNITHIILNNHELGKISKEQKAGNWQVWQTSLSNPNFAEYAKVCGAQGYRIENVEELDQTLEKAFAHKGPSLVEIMTDVDLL